MNRRVVKYPNVAGFIGKEGEVALADALYMCVRVVKSVECLDGGQRHGVLPRGRAVLSSPADRHGVSDVNIERGQSTTMLAEVLLDVVKRNGVKREGFLWALGLANVGNDRLGGAAESLYFRHHGGKGKLALGGAERVHDCAVVLGERALKFWDSALDDAIDESDSGNESGAG
jgi:hypothetical protein